MRAGGGKDEMRKVEIGKLGVGRLYLIQIVSVPSVVNLLPAVSSGLKLQLYT
jgi:hypothetical protein